MASSSSQKTPQKGGGKRGGSKEPQSRKSLGRYPSLLEIGSFQLMIASTSDQGLDLFRGMIEQRHLALQRESAKTARTETSGAAAETGGSSGTGDPASNPKGKKVPVYEQEVFKDIGWINRWGQLTPEERRADVGNVRLMSILTGVRSRLRKAGLELDEIRSIIETLEDNPVMAKAIVVPDLLAGAQAPAEWSEGAKDTWTKLSAYMRFLIKPHGPGVTFVEGGVPLFTRKDLSEVGLTLYSDFQIAGGSGEMSI
jgi:hypothetical protein